MFRIYTRFNVLRAEKEIRDGRKYSYAVIRDITGISTSTLSAYAQNKEDVKAYKKSVLIKLCMFFECELGKLIVLERVEKLGD